MSEPKPSRLVVILARLLLVLFPFLLVALVMEVGLRCLGITYPIWYQTDPERGFALRPGYRGWFITEGKAPIAINRDGMRDREHALEKPAGVYRIAVLGDSFTEALQVRADRTFWSVLERGLGQCGALQGKQIQVLNFGVSSYGTAQEYQTLHHHVWKYDPDLILIAFFGANDVRNNARSLEQNDFMPYYVLRNGKLELDTSFRQSAVYQRQNSWKWALLRGVVDRSHLAQYLNHIRSVVTRMRAEAGAAGGAGGELGLDSQVFQEPTEDRWREAWEVTEALFRQIREEVQAHGKELLVCTVSNALQTAAPADREPYARQHGLDPFYPEERLVAAGRRDGYAVFNLARELQRYGEEKRVVLHGFSKKQYGEGITSGHWNETAHQAAGELLAREVCRQVGSRSL